ncbi:MULTISPECIES: Cof-type HAD-IIB family hydrolase [Bacteroides]|jgi:Cof subfamily protein (haloacid dehalogenase superfamily)|uniref:Haloacid dehalogenase n=2 Tax=Bacteroides fragilis TaxID=817 RepID=A0A0I9S3J5_BACFG|nr:MULTISPECIES: Cof-type HAD-IIB family hydrolase [Bacteroides]MCE8565565.1 Cof-type HAD-IIB family hydrolase [Bacteroides fragilis]MCM0194424.1 Cof-type HAD-IIB family hydrolase [Bacteroides fragilis]MCM0198820.1 Cof-type HAD-IIB family hydrolase [Bacteroides fragilis]MCM0209068.1 Cof-type HAD-IIB family hydrolase [Bacteroides fragilis]MCM0213585.1 Cof-type HAD-IIB family hydrolase [Bacteroides fragilis]
MKYKLLVLDLDGTLTNAKKEITPRNREALIRVQQQGVKLILASGRPTFGIAPLADELRMKEFGGFILSYNGGEIIDWSTGEIVYANVLPDEVIPRLYECATRNQLPILTYDRQYIITEYPDDVYVRKEAFLNKMQIYPSKDFLKDIRLPLPKCLIVSEPHRLIPIEAELSVELQGQLSIYRSEPFFLELVPQGIDKAQSLSVLLNKLNMNREEMVAVGDGYNDLSMIQFAGLGVAMGNAQEPVKKAADYITLSNEEDGVAAVVNKFFTKAPEKGETTV